MIKDREFLVFWKDFRPGIKLEKKYRIFDTWDEAVDFVGEIINSDYIYDIRVAEWSNLEDKFMQIRHRYGEEI